MSTTTVSIILPVYNQAQKLAQTVASVMLQTFQNWELLIIDDGSTDNTMKQAQLLSADNRIHYIYQDHQGFAEAYNNGVLQSRGSYLAFLTVGQVYEAHALSSHMQQFQQFPDTGLSVSPMCWTDEQGETVTVPVIRPPQRSALPLDAIEAWMFDVNRTGGVGLLRRDWYERLLGFEPALDAERVTWLFYLRLALADCMMRPTTQTIHMPSPYLTGDIEKRVAHETESQLDALQQIELQLTVRQTNRYREATAWIYVRAAVALYNAAQLEKGHAMFAEALEAYPELIRWRGVQFLELLLSMVGDDDTLADAIVSKFEIGRKMRRAQSRRHMIASHAANADGNTTDMIAFAKKAVTLNPLWYLNWHAASRSMRYKAPEPQA